MLLKETPSWDFTAVVNIKRLIKISEETSPHCQRTCQIEKKKCTEGTKQFCEQDKRQIQKEVNSDRLPKCLQCRPRGYSMVTHH
jgi:hypothetical protein